jgi:hypothetical protein
MIEISREMFIATRDLLLNGKSTFTDEFERSGVYVKDRTIYEMNFNGSKIGRIVRGLRKAYRQHGEMHAYGSISIMSAISFWTKQERSLHIVPPKPGN